MKRIGILTQYYDSKNIGGLLQAYATVYFLKKLGYKAEQITFNCRKYNKKEKVLHRKLFFYDHFKRLSIQKIIEKFLRILEMFNLLKIKKLNKFIVEQQNVLFKSFEQFINHSKKLYIDDTISNVNSDYDVFVVGSDQVWSCGCFPFGAYFCTFTEPHKKCISYAASSSVKKFSYKAERLFAKRLQKFNAISVREKTLKDYIESITDKKVTVVLDPTFLLSKEEWLKISNPKIISNKKYIFCYFLGEYSSWQRKIAQDYADKYDYEVIHLPYIMRTIRSADNYLRGQGLYNVGPREFISLINNAECIFTDSFHGMAFSINFNKNFYVFNRDDLSGDLSMNSRITDMIDMMDLSSRYITNKNVELDNSLIDYTQTKKILKEEKEKSVKWLLNALKD